MTWLRRSEDLVIATLDGRRAGELLTHPCGCGNHNGTAHSIGQHLFDATRDMTPNGVSAVTYEAKGSSTAGDAESVDPLDPHREYVRLVEAWRATALDLSAFIERHRPDRHLELVKTEATASDDQWCRAHLAAGYCEPRFRNEPLCRWCVEFDLTYRIDPPIDLLTLRHEGRRLTLAIVTASIKAERKRLREEKRKQRSTKATA